MIMTQPGWLLIIIPLVIVTLLWRMPDKTLLILRVSLYGVLVLGLIGWALRLPLRSGTVVIVADRSASMPEDVEGRMEEAIRLIQGRQRVDQSLAVVSFGQDAHVEQGPDPTGQFEGFNAVVNGDASSLAEGLELADSLIDPEGPGRVLVLSDGRYTGASPLPMAHRLRGREIPVDYRSMSRGVANDLAITDLDYPSRVPEKEAFLIRGWFDSPVAQVVHYRLTRGTHIIAQGSRAASGGRNHLLFRDMAGTGGTLRYRLELWGEMNDPQPENNDARFYVGVEGGKPILHVSESGGSGLADLLGRSGLVIELVRPSEFDWDLANLSGYTAVILENVDAQPLGYDGMAQLAAWVRHAGGGLMLTGGRHSYALGGYFESPLDPILPVSMELRREHRKLTVAMVIVLDRSGSMAMQVAGGRRKMDLANLASVAVLDLLTPWDKLGVIAVDSSPHTIAECVEVGGRDSLRNDILRIDSRGGGIFVYEGLLAAADMLNKTEANTKHILLFADAADAEQPGEYIALLEKCREAGITASVVGLGTDLDVDAEFLRDVARRGEGQCFFTTTPEELPRLFAQDFFMMARQSFIDEVTPMVVQSGMVQLSTDDFSELTAVGGYNLCYLRPDAYAALTTQDEYEAPVLAAWPVGSGRVLCYTGEADGRYAGSVLASGRAGDFFRMMARYVTGQHQPFGPGYVVTQELDNGLCTVTLHLDPGRDEGELGDLPTVSTVSADAGGGAQGQDHTMQYDDADTLRVAFPLEGKRVYLSTVAVRGKGQVTLSPLCLPYSPEAVPVAVDTGADTLDQLARITGGRLRVDVADISDDIPRKPRVVGLTPGLALLAIMIFLLEILQRRTNLLTQFGHNVGGFKAALRRRAARMTGAARAEGEKAGARDAGAGGEAASRWGMSVAERGEEANDKGGGFFASVIARRRKRKADTQESLGAGKGGDKKAGEGDAGAVSSGDILDSLNQAQRRANRRR